MMKVRLQLQMMNFRIESVRKVLEVNVYLLGSGSLGWLAHVGVNGLGDVTRVLMVIQASICALDVVAPGFVVDFVLRGDPVSMVMLCY